ncbi:porin family protein [Mesorhizobium sp. CA18]|uniref:outer membrane protein n=2 Tax=unclassified Mesorhizobium TaxID=325217 RepID=UPI001CC9850C|nr:MULTISPECIES: outer membrane protein [unclassified Mesorhizobium]MBZ9732765.1 porin family protein [Mesorhizobium sp. CA9]MBZ9766112.1 porin family protein [Mesorhizobium sp. CA6]MBZ9824795.1 porin family protein [Mesorhizobium sp. CA18]MBZ9830415.1 porin family protein [Mesorhizobium sp. CA2]MBZ9836102.1 porin family protein [Mesorhizobium sp. CA3]
MRKVLLTSAMLVGFCSPVFAADALSVEPTSYNWTGAYIGAVAGVNFLQGDVTIPNNDPSEYDGDSTSASVGGQVGYQYQFDNNFVLGAEARLVAVFNKKTVPTIDAETFETAADWQGDIVAKAGYAMGNFLPYVKGGVAFLHLHDTGYSVLGFGDTKFDRTYTGWTIGVGADYALNDKWVVGLDYAYAHFSDHNFQDDSALVGPTFVKPSTHTVSLSLNYRF